MTRSERAFCLKCEHHWLQWTLLNASSVSDVRSSGYNEQRWVLACQTAQAMHRTDMNALPVSSVSISGHTEQC